MWKTSAALLDDLPTGAWKLRVVAPGGKVWEGTAATAQVALR